MQRQEKTKPQFQDHRRLKPLQVENQQLQPQAQQPPQPQKCPRCDSINTKFCYYNNYSLSQPRYLCKTCRRYWTQGGTLRNVPVGGGCRKGKRAKQPSQSGDITRAQPTAVPSQSLTMSPQHIIFSGTPVFPTSSSYFNRGEDLTLGSSSNWVNSFVSHASDQIYQTIQPVWSESYINNSNAIAAAVSAGGDGDVWTASNSNVGGGGGGVNPSNNNTNNNNNIISARNSAYSSSNLSEWPDYMPGFCPPP